MELADNFVQFSVTLLGFCLSGMRYLKGRKQAYFLLTCFYGCFALGSLYWTLHLFLFSKTPQVFLCIGVWLGGKRYFSFYFAILPFLCGGKRLCVPKGADCLPDRRSLMYILLHLWGYSFESALVRHDDCCFLSCDTGACLCADADGSGAAAAIFPYRGAVLCGGGIYPLDFRLLPTGGFGLLPLLRV